MALDRVRVRGGRGRGRGDGERCSTAGCTNKAQSNGRCRTHTGIGQCTQPGCEKQAQYKGLCVAHGGRRICTHPGCDKTVTSRGKCGDHGGGRRRSNSGARKATRTDAGDVKLEGITDPSMGDAMQSQGSMMSLLLNEWPQEVVPSASDHPPFNPQSGQQVLPAWTGDNVKLLPFEPAAALMPMASVTKPTSSNQAQRSGGSMMSLLLEGWPQDMATAAIGTKTEDFKVERDMQDGVELPLAQDIDSAGRPRNPRKRALCIHEGCVKIAQSQGLCVGHGGKRCLHADCTKSAQYQGLCTTHGGPRTCTYPSCTKTIRSAGRCFEHGGGKQCLHSECTKQAQVNGLCSTHRKFTA